MDAITLAAVAREATETLVGGRIQAVVAPDEQCLALEIFGQGVRRWLLLDARVQTARVHLLAEKARRGIESDSPFLLLARKRLLGSRLTEVVQPSWERVLHFSFAHHEMGPTTLTAEIMGKWSNLVLVAEVQQRTGVILEAARRVGPDQNRYRTTRPGDPYLPPPAQAGKIPIDLVAAADLDRLLAASTPEDPLWRLLMQRIAGLSPLASREIVFRATGTATATFTHPNASASALMDALVWLRSLPRVGGWAPTIAWGPDQTPLAFAPYELGHLVASAADAGASHGDGGLEYFATISQAASAFYAAVEGADSYAGRRARVQALLDAARQRLQARRHSLGEQGASEEEVAEQRSLGEWILAYAWQVRPGDAELLADTGEGMLRIVLDPALSAAENAQAYFARYRKSKRAAGRVPGLLAEVDRDLEFLDQLQTDLHLADNAGQIEELRTALLGAGLISETRRTPRPPVARSQPLRLRSTDGFLVIVGRNAMQNEEVTWKLADAEDTWLHAERTPGSHVIIKSGGRDLPSSTLAQAAAWAAYQSQARGDARVPVLYTLRRHLRRLPHGRPGQVQVLRAQSLVVTPQPLPGAPRPADLQD